LSFKEKTFIIFEDDKIYFLRRNLLFMKNEGYLPDGNQNDAKGDKFK